LQSATLSGPKNALRQGGNMSQLLKEKRAKFRKLHEGGCFVLPNPWDVGSARMLEHLGFVALASTSAGFAWSIGRPDYGLPRSKILAHLTELTQAVTLPVNADFEAGFADDPEGVAESVSLAIATGIAGLSIEDRNVARSELYDTASSLERLMAARSAIDQSGEDVILVAKDGGATLRSVGSQASHREAGRFRRRRRRLPLRAGRP
jgi:2-methylisocitrate lyase-like PEP mutase family enzyme